MQRTLIAVEFAATLVLLCGAGLLLRSLTHISRLPLGFEPSNLLLFRVVLPDTLSGPQRAAFYHEATTRLRALPGVGQVGVVSSVFMTSSPNATIQVEGRPEYSHVRTPVMDDVASPELFRTLQASLRSGRYFSDSDTATSPHVAIINERFASYFWPGEDPVGRRYQFLDGRSADPWITVVGVIGDMRRNGIEEDPYPQAFMPLAQSPSRGADIVMRHGSAPLALAGGATRTIASINPDVPVSRVSTLEQRLDALLSTRRFQLRLLLLFAGAGVLLAAIGVYGLMRYVVTQRRREIGIRVAMGASKREVVGLVLREGATAAGVGLAVGLLLALTLASTMRTLVYGISTTDSLTFALAPLVLVAVSTLACVEPAWRATRVDPVHALRAD